MGREVLESSWICMQNVHFLRFMHFPHKASIDQAARLRYKLVAN